MITNLGTKAAGNHVRDVMRKAFGVEVGLPSRRVSLNLEGEVFRDLDALATRMGWSLSRTASMLLGAAIADANEVFDECVRSAGEAGMMQVGPVLTATGEEAFEEWLQGGDRSSEEIMMKLAELMMAGGGHWAMVLGGPEVEAMHAVTEMAELIAWVRQSELAPCLREVPEPETARFAVAKLLGEAEHATSEVAAVVRARRLGRKGT